MVGKKNRHWQKNLSFFADFFSSDNEICIFLMLKFVAI